MKTAIQRALFAAVSGAVVLVVAELTRPETGPYAPAKLAGLWAAVVTEELAPTSRGAGRGFSVSGEIRLAPPPDAYPSRSLPPPPGSRSELDFASFGFEPEGRAGSRVVVRELGQEEIELRLPRDRIVMHGRVAGDRIEGRWWRDARIGGRSGSFTLLRRRSY